MSNLRIAGPTPLSPEVLQATSQQMINHRGPLYEQLQAKIVDKLKYFFGTKDDIYLLTSSGTGGMEAAIVNFFSPQDKLLAFPIGVFGERWVKIAKAYGANVIVTSFPMGHAVDMDVAQKIMTQHKDAKGVMITHCETSTSVLNDIHTFSNISQKILPQALVMVDSISAMGAVEFEMEKWGIDVAMTGSQKSWGAPPGICMIAISKRAKDKMPNAKMSRYYFDLSIMDKYAPKNQTPATPAVATLHGLLKSLELMFVEGKENIYKRHINLQNRFRKGAKKLGLKSLVDDEIASPTITAILPPTGKDASNWSKILRDKFDTIVSGGKGDWAGKIIRVAHMGYVNSKDIDDTLSALAQSLKYL